MISGGYTATGPRAANEDSFFRLDFEQINTTAGDITSFIMVSDGMGGYQCGDVASRIAVASAESYVTQILEMAQGNLIDFDPLAALIEIANNAHDAIVAESRSRGGVGMGATLVAAFVSPSHAWIAHVGDSRAYLIHDGAVKQLTEDHSKVGRLLSHGVITENEAQNHPDRNRIERALGFGDATPDTCEIDFVKGDALLLCSDGVYTVLNGSQLCECFTKSSDAASVAEFIVQTAIKRGTDDNSTAVVLMEEIKNTRGERKRKRARREASDNVYETTATKDTPRHIVGIIVLLAGVFIGVMAALAIGKLSSLHEDAAVGDSTPTVVIEQNESQDETPQRDNASAYQNVTIPPGVSMSLKYVDAEGTAQLFSYPPVFFGQDVVLKEGSSVMLSAEAESFGRSDRLYRLLSDDYLADLRSDVERYRSEELVPDSTLSRICDSVQYEGLVITLASNDESHLDDGISHLIVDSFDEEGHVADSTTDISNEG